MSMPVVAIVGRPNVGKSTVFNRLVGFQKSVVHDRPGVTRDRLYEVAEAHGRRFILIDTGGLEPVPDTPLLQAMRAQVLVALEEADVILFVVDAQAGYTPADLEVAQLLGPQADLAARDGLDATRDLAEGLLHEGALVGPDHRRARGRLAADLDLHEGSFVSRSTLELTTPEIQRKASSSPPG